MKRLKNLWKLSKLEPEELNEKIVEMEAEGDGGAVFFSDGTDEEYEQYVRDNSGWRKFYKKLKL